MRSGLSNILTKLYQLSEESRQSREASRRAQKQRAILLREKIFSQIAASKGLTFTNGKVTLRSNKMADPVEAGYLSQFFKGIDYSEKVSQKIKAAKAAKNKRARRAHFSRVQHQRPSTLLRQVNGVVYEYHLATCYPAPAINDARRLAGLSPLAPKVKYVRATHPLTKDGFKFVCHAKRARFSIKKVRRGAPQKSAIFRKGDNIIFRVSENKKVTEVGIPISVSRFEGPLPEDNLGSVSKGYFRVPSHIRRIEDASRKLKIQKRIAMKFARHCEYVARDHMRGLKLIGKGQGFIRDPVLVKALRAKIFILASKRTGFSGSTILGSKPVKVQSLDPRLSWEHQMESDQGFFGKMRRKIIASAESTMTGTIDNAIELGTTVIKNKFDELFNLVKEYIPKGVTMKDGRNILLFVTNIVQDMNESFNRFLQNVGNNIVGILNCLDLVSGKMFFLSAAISNYFRLVMNKINKPDTVTNYYMTAESRSMSQTNTRQYEHEMDECAAPIATLICTIAGLIGLKLGPKDKIPNFFDLKNLHLFTISANSMATFVSNHLAQLVKCFEWCHAKVNKYLFDRTLVDQPQELREFLEEASMFTSPDRYEQILRSPVLQVKIFRLTIQAHKLAAVTASSTYSSSLLIQCRTIIAKLSQLQDRLINDCITPNVGYEPWVIFLTGEPGVGKSTIVNHLVPSLLKHINYVPSGEAMFVRSIGSDYFNGLCGQPVCFFDDMFVEEESARRQLHEWMQLKSSVSFVPNCAHLEDKKRRYNPIAVVINANKSYYDGSNLPFCYTPDAINRRRDCMWYVDLCDSEDRKMLGSSKEAIKERQRIMKLMSDYRLEHGKSTFKYYIFFKAINPRIRQSNDEAMNYGPPMTYEQFLEDCKNDFKIYRLQELRAYEERYEFLSQADSTDGLLTPDDADKVIKENFDKYVNKIMKDDVNSSLSMIRRAVDSGVGSIYGQDVLKKKPSELTGSEIIDALEDIDVKLKEKKIDISKVTFGDVKELQHEMDDGKDNSIQDSVTVDSDPTVALVNQGPDQVATQQVVNSEELQTITTDSVETFDHMAGHYYTYDTITWSSNDKFNTEKLAIDIPGAFFTKGEFKNSMNSSIFRGYRFYRFDMEIEIMINATKMDFGSLLCAWKYAESTKNLENSYDHVAQLVQGPHAFVQASNNTVCKFTIPYKYVWPMLVMEPNFTLTSYAVLYIKVFNMLRSFVADCKKVDITVAFRFTNISKSGLFYNLGIEHQMFSVLRGAAIGGVEALLKSMRADKNRDKPSDPRQAVSVVIRTGHSWANGTNCTEEVNILRLDPTSTTPHFDKTDEMTVSHIASIFGYMDTVSWKVSQNSGTEIISFSISPFESSTEVSYQITSLDVDNHKLATYRNTPISTVSAMYSYWRGDLEYRFDFISSFAITGRVFVCFIPRDNIGGASLNWYTYEKCKSFHGVYFDLGESTSFTFRVPYITCYPWLHTDESYRNSRLGYLKMFVVNQVCTGAVATELDINIFIRGGPNFELAVPTLPKVAPSFNPYYYISNKAYTIGVSANDVYFTQNTTLFYKTSVNDTFYCFFACVSKTDLTPAYMNPLLKVMDGKVYLASRTTILQVENDKFYSEVQHFVQVKSNRKLNYVLAVNTSVPQHKSLKWLFDMMKILYPKDEDVMTIETFFSEPKRVKDYLMYEDGKTPRFCASKNEYFTGPSESLGKFSLDIIEEDEPVEHEMDDRTSSSIIVKPGSTSMMSSDFYYNEKFSDLKDLARRYQFYGYFQTEVSTSDDLCEVKARIPIYPSGLYCDYKTPIQSKDRAMLSQQRTGLIPLIGSGYRFYRGGLRLKIDLGVEVVVNVLVSFVHDRRVPIGISTPVITKSSGYTGTGYPMYAQTNSSSPFVEVEIPYYKRMVQLWANRLELKSTHRHALGYLDVSFLQKNPIASLPLKVFYSIADDFRYSTFQGFPSTILLRTIPSPPSLEARKGRQSPESSLEDYEWQMDDGSDSDELDSVYEDVIDCCHAQAKVGQECNFAYNGNDCTVAGLPPGVFLYRVDKMMTDITSTSIPMGELCKNNCFFNSAQGHQFALNWIKYNFGFVNEIDMLLVPPIFRPFVAVQYPEKQIIYSSLKTYVLDEDIKKSKSVLERLRETCKKYFDWAMLKQVAKWVAMAAVFFGACFGAYTFCSDSNRAHMDNPIETAGDILFHQTYKATRKNLSSGPKKKINFARSAFGKSGSKIPKVTHHACGGFNDVTAVIRANMYCCELFINDQLSGSVKATAIKDRLLMTVKHFFDKAERYKDEKVDIVLTRPNVRLVYSYKDIVVETAEDSSLALFTLPRSFALCRDISRHIATEEMISYASGPCIVLDYMKEETMIHPVTVSLNEPIDVPAFKEYEAVHIPASFRYNFGYKGACGSLLITTEGIPKIIGVHIAGNKQTEDVPKVGISEPITQESIQHHLLQNEMFEYEQIDVLDVSCSDPKSIVIPPLNVEVIGTIQSHLVVHAPVKSNKVPTAIKDQVFKTTMMPAPLAKTVEWDPLKLALDKYSTIPNALDQKMLKNASRDVSEMLITYSKPLLASNKQWLSDKEIFEGINAYKQYPAINLQTSEGFPLCLFPHDDPQYKMFRHPSNSGKHWLFKYEMEGSLRKFHKMHPILQEIINTNQALREERIIPATIFTTTLKDQTIAIEKAKAGRNRIFSCAPVQNTWSTKKYFGHWQAAYINSRFDNESAVGINPESIEWTTLAKRLLARGSNIVTGDYSAFGDTLARDAMMEAYDIIESWYKFYYGNQPEYQYCRNQRYMLFLEMVHALHLARNVLFRKLAGIPSGFALTVEINDLVNKLYLRIVFQAITGRPVCDFRRFTYLCTYGDDMILSVSDEIKDVFTFSKIQEQFRLMNIKFTPASKDNESYDFQSIYDATFLKGHFEPHPFRHGIYLHKLPETSILECLNWKNKGIYDNVYLYTAMRSALEGLHAHGKEKLNLFREKMFRIVVENIGTIFPCDGKPDLPTWEDIDEKLYGGH